MHFSKTGIGRRCLALGHNQMPFMLVRLFAVFNLFRRMYIPRLFLARLLLLLSNIRDGARPVPAQPCDCHRRILSVNSWAWRSA